MAQRPSWLLRAGDVAITAEATKMAIMVIMAIAVGMSKVAIATKALVKVDPSGG